MPTTRSTRQHGLRWKSILPLIGIIVLLSGCSLSTPTAASATSTVPANTPTVAATATPASGVCNTADFPPPIRQPPNPPVGGDLGPFYGAPVSDFPFPPGTYYRDFGPAAGTHFWDVCSPGDPTSILAFMRQSIAASAWTLLTDPSNSTTTLAAQLPATQATTSTPAYCRTLQVVVGGFPGYLGEWSFGEFAPASPCQ